TLLKADSEVTAHLSPEELDKIFDYQYYLTYIDEIFQRLGLTETQRKTKSMKNKLDGLAPMTI
ncbi:adenylosuccinate lyase, partial [Chloroflexota bacterium]